MSLDYETKRKIIVREDRRYRWYRPRFELVFVDECTMGGRTIVSPTERWEDCGFFQALFIASYFEKRGYVMQWGDA